MGMDRQEGLLPENIDLDFNGKKLYVGKKINEGATAEIFTGKLEISEDELVEVAIKVLNPAGFQFGEKDFLDEIMTLRFLMEYEKTENEITNSDFYIAPHFYGRSKYGDTSFFVMEFIQGTRVAELMATKNSLSEEQSLIIAWNLFRTIHILHKELDESYIDLKFNDFWWVERRDGWGGQLKLTDFGSMDPIKGENYKVQRDVLRCSVLFFQMLSGYSLSYNQRDLKERADKLIDKLEVSWGTRNILQKMLHRNREYRFKTAQEITSKLFNLAHFWILSEDEIITDVQKKIDNLTLLPSENVSDDMLDLAWTTKAGLDIWLTKTGQPESSVQSMLSKVNKILKTNDEIENGIKFFEMREFDLSKRNFDRAVDYSDDIIRANRWLLLSEAVRELPANNFSEIKLEVTKINELLQEGDYLHAINRLDRLNLNAKSDNIQQLIQEANFYQQYETAQMHIKVGELSLAAEKLAAAEEWLGKIPYSKLIIDEEGSIQDKREEIERLRDSRGQSQKLISEAENLMKQGDWILTLQKLEQAYMSAPDSLDNLQTFIDVSRRAVKEGAFSEAYKLSELGLRVQRNKKELVEIKTLAGILAIGDGFYVKRNYLGLLDFLERNANYLAKHFDSKQVILRWLEFVKKEAAANHDLMALKNMELVVNKLDSLNQSDMAADLELNKEIILERKLRDEKAEDLIGNALAFINFDRDASSFLNILRNTDLVHQIDFISNRNARLDQANLWLDQALELAGNPEKQTRISNLKKILLEEKAKIGTLLTKTNLNFNSSQDKFYTNIPERFEQLKLSGKQGKEIASESNLKIKIDELLSDCYQYLNAVDQKDEKINEIIIDLCNYIDLHTPRLWNEAAKDYEDPKGQYDTVFESVKQDYNNCEPDKALVKLNELAAVALNNPIWLDSKINVLAAYTFQRFIQENEQEIEANVSNNEILSKLRTYSRLKLPIQYWQKAKIGQYIKQVCARSKKAVLDSRKQVEDPEFLGLLKKWIDAEYTAREFSENIANGRGE